MGAQPWYYFVPYNPDPTKALNALREREFKAGRYYPVLRTLDFHASPFGPGAGHSSIEQAVRAAGETGTRSIMDMTAIDTNHRPGILVELSSIRLVQLYGSTIPTHEMVVSNMDFFSDLDRGQGVFFTVFAEDKPTELFFAGYSYD